MTIADQLCREKEGGSTLELSFLWRCIYIYSHDDFRVNKVISPIFRPLYTSPLIVHVIFIFVNVPMISKFSLKLKFLEQGYMLY